MNSMTKDIAIIGGGPSGLMAADVLSANGHKVTIYERKPTIGRKFLMAGRGGLNLTHSEDLEKFITKYNDASKIFKPLIENFSPQDLCNWCEKLGEKTFIGSSGRVFPESFKASPLLRKWLTRLKKNNVIFKTRHEWQGWGKDNQLLFNTEEKTIEIKTDAVLLALGGASWPTLGSNGLWVKTLEKHGVAISPLRPSNCGFVVEWSDVFANKFEGKSLKSVTLSIQDKTVHGEFVMTKKGVEGSAIYALSSFIRNEIDKNNLATLNLDLKPDFSIEEIEKRLQRPKSKLSTSNYLRKTLNLSDVAIGLLMELPNRKSLSSYTPKKMALAIKFYKLNLKETFSIDRAISSAGGISFDSLDEHFMLINKLGVFVSGEMLDWEAPTGGYLLQACMASGIHAANGIENWIKTKNTI